MKTRHKTMKPVVSTFQAYCCFITSSFAIVILSVIGYLFQTNSESFMGSINDPEDGKAVAKTVFSAVLYIWLLPLWITNFIDSTTKQYPIINRSKVIIKSDSFCCFV